MKTAPRSTYPRLRSTPRRSIPAMSIPRAAIPIPSSAKSLQTGKQNMQTTICLPPPNTTGSIRGRRARLPYSRAAQPTIQKPEKTATLKPPAIRAGTRATIHITVQLTKRQRSLRSLRQILIMQRSILRLSSERKRILLRSEATTRTERPKPPQMRTARPWTFTTRGTTFTTITTF